MKTIVIKYSAKAENDFGESVAGMEQEWATNSRGGGGLFSRKKDGTWQQHVGNCDTPPFRSPADLRNYLRKAYDIRNARIIDQSGW